MRGATYEEKLGLSWDELQSDVDHILDKGLNKQTDGEKCLGVKQVLFLFYFFQWQLVLIIVWF
jgi:hypothetical protein